MQYCAVKYTRAAANTFVLRQAGATRGPPPGGPPPRSAPARSDPGAELETTYRNAARAYVSSSLLLAAAKATEAHHRGKLIVGLCAGALLLPLLLCLRRRP